MKHEKVFFSSNHLSSVTLVSDAMGVAWQHMQYEPYGEGWVNERSNLAYNAGFSSRYRFTGKERDAESGLDYFGARYYWSGGGLWLSVDPLADEYPFMSGYIYAADNPLYFVDVDGLDLLESEGLPPVFRMIKNLLTGRNVHAKYNLRLVSVGKEKDEICYATESGRFIKKDYYDKYKQMAERGELIPGSWQYRMFERLVNDITFNVYPKIPGETIKREYRSVSKYVKSVRVETDIPKGVEFKAYKQGMLRKKEIVNKQWFDLNKGNVIRMFFTVSDKYFQGASSQRNMFEYEGSNVLSEVITRNPISYRLMIRVKY